MAESLAANAATFMEEIRPVRNHMCKRIFAEIEDVELNGHKDHHLTNHLNIRIKNVSAAVVQKALKELYYKTKHVNNFLNKETLV